MDPDSDRIHLDISQTDDLEPIIPQLALLPNLKYLHLCGNSLNNLGDDLSKLRIEVLDLDQNIGLDFEKVVCALKTLPNLKHLFAPFEQKSYIQTELPNLLSYNSRSLVDYEITIPLAGSVLLLEDSDSDIDISTEFPTTISNKEQNQKFDVIPNSPPPVSAFDSSARLSLNGIACNLKFDVGLFSQAVVSLDADDSDIQELFEVATPILNDLKGKNDPLATIQYHRSINEKAFRIASEIFVSKLPRQGRISVDNMFLAMSQQNTMLDTVISHLSGYFANSMLVLQKRNAELEEEHESLLKAARTLEMESENFARETSEISAAFHKERTKLLDEIKLLRSQLNLSQTSSPKRNLNSTTYTQLAMNSSNSVYNYNPYNSEASAVSFSGQYSSPVHSPSSTQNKLEAARKKKLSKLQLDEMIEELLTSFSNKKVHETLAEHLYTMLHLKYGLPNLITKNATAFFDGIVEFQHEDIFVKVLGKVLDMNLDFNTYKRCVEVRETVYDIIKDISSLNNTCSIPNEILKENEWPAILNIIFQDESLGNSIELFDYMEDKMSDDQEIYVVDFINALIKYILDKREQSLSAFITAFRNVDEDEDGKINYEQFLRLGGIVGYNGNLKHAIKQLDKNQTGILLFDECAQFFFSM
eukprot:TRINITY_DN3148_c1_g14_i1.p1 TRINITY_DN3148_c1_g14~~TRINITY_DN3148_c1_g14_i1.p1  ORF type:complete len:644 (+),score=203.41 TRINITY_DN3148_c1_g14_i1:35-1966(+)